MSTDVVATYLLVGRFVWLFVYFFKMKQLFQLYPKMFFLSTVRSSDSVFDGDETPPSWRKRRSMFRGTDSTDMDSQSESDDVSSPIFE